MKLVDELLQTLSQYIISITEKRDNVQHRSRNPNIESSAAAPPNTSKEPDEENLAAHSFYQTRHTGSRLVAPIVGSSPTPKRPSADESSSQKSAQELV